MTAPTGLVVIDRLDESHQSQLLALFQSAWWTAQRQPEAITRMHERTDVVAVSAEAAEQATGAGGVEGG